MPPLLEGKIRWSYVLWCEYTPPLIALEFASGDGSEERDRTPLRTLGGDRQKHRQKPGKFWVYEQIIRIPYYGIYLISTGELEVYHWQDFAYEPVVANERGHYPIKPLEVELGVWFRLLLGPTRATLAALVGFTGAVIAHRQGTGGPGTGTGRPRTPKATAINGPIATVNIKLL
jgi:Uma2 family endonuclease